MLNEPIVNIGSDDDELLTVVLESDGVSAGDGLLLVFGQFDHGCLLVRMVPMDAISGKACGVAKLPLQFVAET